MGDRVDIFRLEAGQSYTIVKSKKQADLLSYVHDRNGGDKDSAGRTYLMAHQSIFAQRRPPKLQSIDELDAYRPPAIEAAPVKYMCIANGDDCLLIGLDGPVGDEERTKLMSDFKLAAAQKAIAGASKSDLVPRYMNTALIAIVGLVVLVVCLIMLIGMQEYLGDRPVAVGGGEVPAVAPAQPAQPQENVGPAPTPVVF